MSSLIRSLYNFKPKFPSEKKTKKEKKDSDFDGKKKTKNDDDDDDEFDNENIRKAKQLKAAELER